MRKSTIVARSATKSARREMRVRIPRHSWLARFALGHFGRVLIIGFALFVIIGLGAFTYFYSKYARLFDEKLRAGLFANTAKIFAAPESIALGDQTTPAAIAAELRRSGY